MKTVIRIQMACALLVIVSAFANAQSKEDVRDFKVRAGKRQIILASGESGTMELQVKRSKRFKNREIKLSINPAALPQGVAVEFEPNPTRDQVNVMRINADSDALPGSYFLIVNGETSLLRRGLALKLVIEDPKLYHINPRGHGSY